MVYFSFVGVSTQIKKTINKMVIGIPKAKSMMAVCGSTNIFWLNGKKKINKLRKNNFLVSHTVSNW
jgi:hypothetical protein